jgi:serine protease Do
MTRRFLAVTVCLSATLAFMVGLIVAGSLTPSRAVSAPERVISAPRISAPPLPAGAVSFSDIAERLNPAVVNIDATTEGARAQTRVRGIPLPDAPPEPFDRQQERDRDGPRRGAGTGFVIDASGFILTNHHVIEGAERIMVRLTDGRTLRARTVGSDPDTDIALIKVSSTQPLPFAPLGDSDALRVGEWVVAIGNPLAYEHTVTVGVVSFIGRKLFDSSLDRYIQTDAAINFGNSGGPLINARGEVIGINSAISSRASNIGFAVPINQASDILPQLRDRGYVSRGYIGVMLRDVDADLQRSLKLTTAHGALVQDVTPGSPGARAGVRTYDVIVAVDGASIAGNDDLIQLIASRQPGTVAMLDLVRDGRSMSLPVKLAERPVRSRADTDTADERPARPTGARATPLGVLVRDLDTDFARRLRLPDGTEGVVISRVDPLGPAADAGVSRGHVVLEVNRQPVRTIEDFRRLTSQGRSGDVFTLYLYKPENGGGQRALHTVRID